MNSRPPLQFVPEEAEQSRILQYLRADDASSLAAHLQALAKPAPEVRIRGEDVLTLAIRHNARHCVKPLARLGFNLNRLSPQDGKHPIEEAMDAQAHLVLEYLLEGGANPNSPHTEYGTLMRAAATTRTIDSLIPLLCTKGGDPNSLDPRDDSTPLHAAVAKGQTLNVEQLLECGAFVDAADVMGRTPLHLAMVLPECTPIATLLLDHGADPRTPDVGGLSPIDLAGVREEAALVQLLLERIDWPVLLAPAPLGGLPAFRSGDEYRQRLVETVRRGSRKALLELLDQGGPVWAPVASVKESPLLQALLMRRFDLAAPLLARELGVRDIDSHRRNAIYYLLFASRNLEALVPFAQALVRIAPELPDARDGSGRTSLDAAIDGGAPIARPDAERLFPPR